MSVARRVRVYPTPHLKLVRAPQRINLCGLDAIPLGQGRAFVIDDHAVAIFRQRDGGVFAIENACPHRGGPLAEGIAGGGSVICPLHGLKIDLRSGPCATEGTKVRTYPVEIVDARIWLTVEAE